VRGEFKLATSAAVVIADGLGRVGECDHGVDVREAQVTPDRVKQRLGVAQAACLHDDAVKCGHDPMHAIQRPHDVRSAHGRRGDCVDGVDDGREQLGVDRGVDDVADDHADALTVPRGDEPEDQRRLAGAEKPGDDRDRQARVDAHIIISKADLVSPGELSRVRARVRALNPAAEMLAGGGHVLDCELLLDRLASTLSQRDALRCSGTPIRRRATRALADHAQHRARRRRSSRF